MTFYVDTAGNTSRHIDSVGQNAGQHGAGSHEPLPCIWDAIDAGLRALDDDALRAAMRGVIPG